VDAGNDNHGIGMRSMAAGFVSTQLADRQGFASEKMEGPRQTDGVSCGFVVAAMLRYVATTRDLTMEPLLVSRDATRLRTDLAGLICIVPLPFRLFPHPAALGPRASSMRNASLGQPRSLP
jgi:hypothetical protein